MQITVIASGSNGNCALIETKDTSILVDAGKSGKEIEHRMSCLKKDIKKVKAILTTHEHRDHIIGIGVLHRRYNIPVYMTKETYLNSVPITGRLDDMINFNIDKTFKIADLSIRPIKTSHDTDSSCGFKITDKKRSFGIITDTGYVTEEIKNTIKDLDAVLIESNHDIDMLLKGPYPYFLKNRILNEKGHLSNAVAADLIKKHSSEKLKLVILGHLSENNTTKELTEKTFKTIARSKLDQLKFCTASRDTYTGSFDI